MQSYAVPLNEKHQCYTLPQLLVGKGVGKGIGKGVGNGVGVAASKGRSRIS